MFEYIPIEEDLFSQEIGGYKSFSIKVFLVVEDKYEIHKENVNYNPEQLSLKLSSIIPQLVYGLELRMVEEKLKEVKNSISIASRVPGADEQVLALMKEQSELNAKKKQVSADLANCKLKRLEV